MNQLKEYDCIEITNFDEFNHVFITALYKNIPFEFKNIFFEGIIKYSKGEMDDSKKYIEFKDGKLICYNDTRFKKNLMKKDDFIKKMRGEYTSSDRKFYKIDCFERFDFGSPRRLTSIRLNFIPKCKSINSNQFILKIFEDYCEIQHYELEDKRTIGFFKFNKISSDEDINRIKEQAIDIIETYISVK